MIQREIYTARDSFESCSILKGFLRISSASRDSVRIFSQGFLKISSTCRGLFFLFLFVCIYVTDCRAYYYLQVVPVFDAVALLYVSLRLQYWILDHFEWNFVKIDFIVKGLWQNWRFGVLVNPVSTFLTCRSMNRSIESLFGLEIISHELNTQKNWTFSWVSKAQGPWVLLNPKRRNISHQQKICCLVLWIHCIELYTRLWFISWRSENIQNQIRKLSNYSSCQ